MLPSDLAIFSKKTKVAQNASKNTIPVWELFGKKFKKGVGFQEG